MRSRAYWLLTALFCIVAVFARQDGLGAAEQVQRPLVLVPGILGSKLCTRSGEVVWGTGSSLSNFHRLQLDGPSPEELEPCGIIDKVDVFGPLYSIKAYQGLLKTLADMGFADGGQLHVFAYDWRRSNSKSAELLKDFIDDRRRKGLIRGEIDILAHSMGGIVTRIYLDRNPRHQVKKVIYLGTPFLGSANTLGTFSEGWGYFQNRIAGGIEKIREVVLSLPGFMELLPRHEKCCYVRNADRSRRDIDVFSAAEWKRLGWLPAALSDDPVRFAALKARLEAAKSLSPLLLKGVPGVTEVKFVGDRHATRTYFAVYASAPQPSSSNWRFEKDKGDGAVSIWSAARDATFGSLAGSLVTFAEHATLFDDNWVKAELRYELLTISPTRREPISGRGHPTLSAVIDRDQRNWTIVTMNFEGLSPTYKVGDRLDGLVRIELQGPTKYLQAGLVKPVVTLRREDVSRPAIVTDSTTKKDSDRGQLVFAVQVDTAGLSAGGFEMEFSVPALRDDVRVVSRLALLSD